MDLLMEVYQCTIFIYDGASHHTLKIVHGVFKKSKVTMITWPGNSPDLSPIENLPTVIKNDIVEKQPESYEDYMG